MSLFAFGLFVGALWYGARRLRRWRQGDTSPGVDVSTREPRSFRRGGGL